MRRRDFLKLIGATGIAASTPYYFDMGKNLWRRKLDVEMSHLLLDYERSGTTLITLTDRSNGVSARLAFRFAHPVPGENLPLVPVLEGVEDWHRKLPEFRGTTLPRYEIEKDLLDLWGRWNVRA